MGIYSEAPVYREYSKTCEHDSKQTKNVYCTANMCITDNLGHNSRMAAEDT